jgi:hypothetical protein
VAKFHNVGTVGRKASSGASKKRTSEIVADVAARIEQCPKKPPRRLALIYGTCHKILKQDLNLHSYKTTVVQNLLPRDFPTRIRYLSVVFESSKFLILNYF